MATKKTNTERIKDNANRISELEAQVAALVNANGQSEEAPKPVKKSTTAKPKTTTKKPAAKKPAAKKSTTAKPKATTKKPTKPKAEEVAAEEPAPENVLSEEAVQAIAEAQAFAENANVEEPHQAEEVTAEAPAPDEPKPEEPAPVEAPAPAPDEHKEEEPVPAPVEEQTAEVAAVTEKPAKKGGVVGKVDAALKSKKAVLPIFIAINALFLLSTILLMFTTFAFGTKDVTENYNIFQYFANGDIVKAHLQEQVADWANGAYVMLGIFMFLAMLLPLALIIKNIIISVRKKEPKIFNGDAIIYFATMIGFVALVNLFGAWLSAGQVIGLIIASLILAFTLFEKLITKSAKQLPFFSLVNIIVVFIALFLLTWKVYAQGDYALAPAAAGSIANGGGFLFFIMFIAVAALVALVVMQMKRFRGKIGFIIEIIVPIAAAVCSLIALITAGVITPDGWDLSAGFVIGAILVMLLAIADTLFTFIAPLNKFKVMVDDSDDGNGNNVFLTSQPMATSSEPAQEEEGVEEKPEAHEEKDENAEKPAEVYCPNCGTKNAADSAFCMNCGSKLN